MRKSVLGMSLALLLSGAEGVAVAEPASEASSEAGAVNVAAISTISTVEPATEVTAPNAASERVDVPASRAIVVPATGVAEGTGAASAAGASREPSSVPPADPNEPRVKVFGTDIPTLEGPRSQVQAQVQQYRQNQEANNRRLNVYTDQNGNTIVTDSGYSGGIYGGYYYNYGNGYYDGNYGYGQDWDQRPPRDPYYQYDRPYHDRPYYGRPHYDRPHYGLDGPRPDRPMRPDRPPRPDRPHYGADRPYPPPHHGWGDRPRPPRPPLPPSNMGQAPGQQPPLPPPSPR